MEKSEIFLYISLFSFLLFFSTSLAAIFQPHKISSDVIIFWTIFTEEASYFDVVIPLTINPAILYIFFIILILLSIAACVFIIIYRKDSNILSAMFGSISQFHFVPILCASALFIIGDSFSEKNIFNDEPYIFSFIFSIIGLASLIFIYLKTSIESNLPVKLVIKKGLYPFLMILFIYNIFFTFGFYGVVRKSITFDWDTLEGWVKGCSVAFCIIMGLINLGLVFLFKDVSMAIMNFLIYLGLIIYFFNINKQLRSEMNGSAEGVLEIILEVIALAEISFMIFKYKNELLN